MRISDWSSDVCSSDLLHNLRGDPGIVGFNQAELAHVIFAMPVETSRYKNEFGLEFAQPGQPCVASQLMQSVAAGIGVDGDIHHIGRGWIRAHIRKKDRKDVV